ncbi:MAG: hypothetical protein D5R99_00590 [Methanocalculus sp. MSAO_Arc1]|nr:MAG: hypothetical protein D5R99_00590 [Methanocalculus sp. MSAO_Arc1]
MAFYAYYHSLFQNSGHIRDQQTGLAQIYDPYFRQGQQGDWVFFFAKTVIDASDQIPVYRPGDTGGQT